MAEVGWLQRNGLTPIKGAAIAVLALVLCAVIALQFGGGDAATGTSPNVDAKRRKPQTKRARPRARTRTVAAAPQRAAVAKPWPTVSVDQAIQFNPFNLPTPLADAGQGELLGQPERTVLDAQERDRRIALQQALLQEGVRMIVVGEYGKSAYVGGQLVREGDVIDGFVVKKIAPDGVEFVDQNAP